MFMPLIGLVLGILFGKLIGDVARYLGEYINCDYWN